jgi:hypothetical protein
MTLLYLDPNTGSLLIQFLIAALSALILFFKQIKQTIKHIFFPSSKKNSEDKE